MAWCATTNKETEDFLSSLRWGNLLGETVMDVGCGMGYMSTKCILHCFPRVSQIIAIDKDPECILRSRKELKDNIFKKVKYHCASITHMDELKQWKGQISKIVSTHCLSFVKRQERAFKNMFLLLKPGGEAALLFVNRSESDDVYLEMTKNPKWAEYLEHLNTKTVVKLQQSDPTYYSRMLRRLGFLVLSCKENIGEIYFDDDEEYTDGVLDSTFVDKIPEELEDEFIEETLSTFMTLHPRDEAGRLRFKYSMIQVLIAKV